MFEDQTFEVIMQRMLSRIPDDFDKRQGSVIWDMLAPSALELEQVYQQFDLTVQWLFLNKDTPREILVARAKDLGIEPKPAEKASGTVVFTGQPDTVIPANTRISTGDSVPIFFYTTSDATVTENGTVSVPVEAEVPGAAGNVPSGAITALVSTIDGVESVTNPQAFENGIDEESDESILTRYFERITMPSSSGNDADYIRWAKEVPGIGYVRVFRRWNGPGTVRVVVITDQKKSPSPQMIDKVKDNIETKRPTLADVTVDGAREVSIDIDVKVTLNEQGDMETALQQIKNSINDYLLNAAFFEQTVRYTKVGEAILNAGYVLDYENLKINGGTANIQLNDDEIAVLGRVTLL
ncbi:baseplate J protein [Geobacillus sp. 46C-IIa]|uniref:baseplate J/gp47 family protein n=1 Tax=Geobacillus sp. 46C-IIa TaxID=1963025 RepID=UPI0009BE5DB4|nr:baseplate J/gp47 family protein [Geobacillus sp. 46C-IIa]OQP06853.1 baseplate J protein [Geobacillus sp. 46C-IIa]QNU27429.1 baseplate J/gp47 family protein [Geobacillus sp. 46C-IIa]